MDLIKNQLTSTPWTLTRYSLCLHKETFSQRSGWLRIRMMKWKDRTIVSIWMCGIRRDISMIRMWVWQLLMRSICRLLTTSTETMKWLRLLINSSLSSTNKLRTRTERRERPRKTISIDSTSRNILIRINEYKISMKTSTKITSLLWMDKAIPKIRTITKKKVTIF